MSNIIQYIITHRYNHIHKSILKVSSLTYAARRLRGPKTIEATDSIPRTDVCLVAYLESPLLYSFPVNMQCHADN